ncbi:MAG: general secretion pathway protein GspB [Woeseia sp.]
MSFILDALKKSEAERQRKSVPGFADIPDGRNVPPPQRWWWAIGALVAVNLAVFVGMFFRTGDTEPIESEPAQKATEIPVAATTSPAAFSDIVAEARKNRPERDLPNTTEPQREEPAPTATRPERGTTSMDEALTTLDELRANGTLQLPDLHLDIHVYSEQPAERFVFINMSKYKEDAALAEGPVVKEIRPDGVVLEHRGARFLMPRQ